MDRFEPRRALFCTGAAALLSTTSETFRGLLKWAGRRERQESTQPYDCWDEDEDDFVVIMEPKLQRELDRQRSIRRAQALPPHLRFICSICLDQLPRDDVFCGGSCGSQCGKVCRDCVKEHILSKIADQTFPVKCPSGTCDLAQHDVATVLDNTAMLRYLMLERADYVRTHPRCFVCPCPSADGNGCPGIVEIDEGQTLFVCPVCNHRRCVECDVEAGTGTQHPTSCEQYQSWKRANERSDAAAEEYLDSDSSNRVRCPRCRMAIERDYGCNHMICVCRTHFCMVCRQQINSFLPYEHFRQREGRNCSLFPVR